MSRLPFKTATVLIPLVFLATKTSFSAPFRLAHTWKSPGGVSALAFAPHKKQLWMGLTDGTVCAWDFGSNTHRTVWKSRTGEQVSALSFSRSGRYLAIGVGADVAIWNTRKRKLQWLRHQSHTDLIQGLSFSPDATLLASSHYDSQGEGGFGGWSVWSTLSGRHLRAQQCEMLNDVSNIVFARDNRTLITRYEDGFYLWKRTKPHKALFTSGRKISDKVLKRSIIARMALHDYSYISSEEAEFKRALMRMDIEKVKGPGIDPPEWTQGVAAFSPDGRWLLTAGQSWVVPIEPRQISLWDLSQLTQQTSLPIQRIPGMALAAFSPLGHVAATGMITPDPDSADMIPGRIIRLWDY